MRLNLTDNQGLPALEPRPRRRRPDHPEDYGRGPWWRLAELLVLGVVLPSPPPITRMFDDEDDEAGA
ncbi:MAG TPA: hypothetical protein VK358_07825 [Longimicrobium sp.]|nr:hypothetical protein [Longimicrobium sp.]